MVQTEQIAREFAVELRKQLGARVRHILLFGSRARGDAREGSDYDMLVVIDRRTPDARAAVLEVEKRLMDRYMVLVATVLRGEEEWRHAQGFPFALNIARESVPL